MDQSANPSIFTRKNIVIVVIALLIVGFAAKLFSGGIALFSPSSLTGLNNLTPKASDLTDASLSLVPDQASYISGDEVEIEVKLFTGGNTTDSTDLVIKYDPEFLAPAEDGFALEGGLYSEYPAMQVDKENGLIGISGITVPGGKSFTGEGNFATIYFTALKNGQTTVSIDFEKGQTADSNVVLTGSTQDILGSVKNANIVIARAK